MPSITEQRKKPLIMCIVTEQVHIKSTAGKRKEEKRKIKKKRVADSIRLLPQCPHTKLRSYVNRKVLLLIEFI